MELVKKLDLTIDNLPKNITNPPDKFIIIVIDIYLSFHQEKSCDIYHKLLDKF